VVFQSRVSRFVEQIACRPDVNDELHTQMPSLVEKLLLTRPS